MIKLVAALFLVLGSGLILKALVEIDSPTLRLRPQPRRPLPRPAERDREPATLRPAA
jgi:hypothetical protein